MPRPSRRTRLSLLIIVAVICPAFAVAAAGEESDATPPRVVAIPGWLRLGPVETPLPAFHDAPDKGFKVKDLLEQGPLRPALLEPRAGDSVPWPLAGQRSWSAATGDPLAIGTGGAHPAQAYLAVHVEVDRWLKAF
jgi:hypothetical protein